MTPTKSEGYTERDVWLARWAKALGHPARVAILRVLAERQTCICGEIVEILPLAQATVSQHLKALREAGLISGTIEGPRSCYCLNREALGVLRSTLVDYLDVLERADGCCR